MHYFIDGYNLLFRTLPHSEDLAFQRQQIILDLDKKAHLLHLDLTLVFDSQYQPGESERFHYNHLEITFTNHGETADEFIITAVKKTDYPASHTVVTSDKRLAWQARRKNAKTENVEEFLSWLNKRYKNRLKQSVEAHREIKSLMKNSSEEPAKLSLSSRTLSKSVSRVLSEISSSSTPEACFTFYLEEFTKKLHTLSSEASDLSLNPGALKRLHRQSQKRKKETEAPSEMERWLTIFERKVNEPQN